MADIHIIIERNDLTRQTIIRREGTDYGSLTLYEDQVETLRAAIVQFGVASGLINAKAMIEIAQRIYDEVEARRSCAQKTDI